MDSYEAIKADLMQHVRHLCVELGPRPRGSPASHATAAYIRGGFETAGLDVDEQTFQCPLWEHESTLLDLNGTTVEAAANPFSALQQRRR